MTTSPSKLDLTKPVRTRSGRPVRIICTDRKGAYPVLYLVENDSGGETAVPCYSDGLCYKDTQTANDLVNVPETVRVCFYKNVHRHFCTSVITSNVTDEEARTWGYEHICIKDIELS